MRSKLATPMDLGQQRLVRWLERYPFQRAQDLVVALGPWEGRGAVYRRIAELEDRQLIESVRLGTSTRERLYHLSPPGRSLCATWHVGGQGSRLVFREEREKLVSLLPRLPIWLAVQGVVNGLVHYAGRALARVGTGEEASAVRWNWLRDYHHPFVARGQAERMLSVRADGALALCVRFSDQREEWHTFLFLHCPLDDGRLLQHRLDRLVRWRDSAERSSSQMPLVLILATSARQAEWWQLANAQVATRLRQEGLVGAITTLAEDGHLENGWRLAWRTLGTSRQCHLQELLSPSSTPALPELLEEASAWFIGEQHGVRHPESAQVACVPAYPGKHSYGLTAAAQRESQMAVQGSETTRQRDYRLLSLLLAPREWEILLLLWEHPLLSREELSVWLGVREKTAQMLLASLARMGLLTRVETQAGARWHLVETGLRLLARCAACHVYRFVRVPIRPDAPLVQRGLVGLLYQIRHTAGVYSFFANVATSLAADSRLCWWETGAMCEQVFTYGEQVYHFKPDAFACVQMGTRQVRFWLEWDRGTMGVRDLERKCATYAAYLTSREWARGGAVPPMLVYVAPEIDQERRFARTACALLAHLPALHLYTTTASLVTRLGVTAPVFQHVACQQSGAPQLTLAQGAMPILSQRIALFAKEGVSETPLE